MSLLARASSSYVSSLVSICLISAYLAGFWNH